MNPRCSLVKVLIHNHKENENTAKKKKTAKKQVLRLRVKAASPRSTVTD